MFTRAPTNYFSSNGELIPFDDAPPDGPSPKTPPEKWPTEFSSFESLFTIPISFVASRTLTREEAVLMCEISRIGAKLDMIIKLYMQEAQRTQIFENAYRTFQTAPPNVLPLIPLIQAGATESLNHVKELHRQFELTIGELRKAKDGLILWIVANRGFSTDPESGKSAAEKRRQLADAEEILLQRIDQLLASKGDVYKHTNQTWQQILLQITGGVEMAKPSATSPSHPLSSSASPITKMVVAPKPKEKSEKKKSPPAQPVSKNNFSSKTESANRLTSAKRTRSADAMLSSSTTAPSLKLSQPRSPVLDSTTNSKKRSNSELDSTISKSPSRLPPPEKSQQILSLSQQRNVEEEGSASSPMGGGDDAEEHAEQKEEDGSEEVVEERKNVTDVARSSPSASPAPEEYD